MGVSGLAVELVIKDRPLADRIAAVLQDLNIALVEPGSDPVSIVLTDTLPETGTGQPTILLADDIEVCAALRAGVTGVLPKSAGTTDLRIALEAAGQGLAIAPLSMLEDAHRECDDFEPFAPATSITFTPRGWRSLHFWLRAHPTRRSRRSSIYPYTRQRAKMSWE